MVGLFHDKPGGSNGMEKAFQRGDRASTKAGSLHQRRVHPLDAVQLTFGATAGIKQSGLFEHVNRPFDGQQRGFSLTEYRVAGSQGVSQT